MAHPLENIEWESIRHLVAVSDAGSFARAAKDGGMALNTLRRAIDRMEDQLGFALFHRDAEGVRLTAEGRRVIVAARDMQKSFLDVVRVASGAADTKSGPVRLAVTEGLGTYWLVPHLVRYTDELRGKPEQVRVELQCAMRSVDIMRLEADVSIQLTEPTNPDLIARRLGWLHLTTFASPGYLARFGTPKMLPELIHHRIVEQETDQLGEYNLDQIFGPGSRDRMVLLKTNFSSAHYWAVANGGGIGALPNYARVIGAALDFVDVGFVMRVPIYMAIHPELQKSARHRKFVDWLTECFASTHYPWFGEKFISPDEIEAEFRQKGLGNFFNALFPEVAGAA